MNVDGVILDGELVLLGEATNEGQQDNNGRFVVLRASRATACARLRALRDIMQDVLVVTKENRRISTWDAEGE